MILKRYSIPAAFALLVVVVLVFVLGCASREEHGMMHSIDSEYEFLVEMIPHHQEAVDSAGETAARTARPELRAFAQEMMSAQSEEIVAMQTWLADWYPGKRDKAAYRPMMRPTAGLSPDRADRAFLEDMIMHHRMAVMMADQIVKGRLTERPELLKLADDIIRTQNAEIERMETWLLEWYGVKSSGHKNH
jgi:uncharacterized protein (DUF305 family)